MISSSRSWWTSTWSTRSSCEGAAGPPAAPRGRPVSAACSAASSVWGTCAWLSRPSPPRDCRANLRREVASWRRNRSLRLTRDWSSQSGGRKGRPGGDTSRLPEVKVQASSLCSVEGVSEVLLCSFYLLRYSVILTEFKKLILK